jgi:class 3 adenylate cyclase
VAGLLLPVSAFARAASRPSLVEITIMLLLIGLTALFSNLRVNFSHGDRSIEVASDTSFALLSVLILAPPLAALVSMVSSIWRARHFSRWHCVARVSNAALATGVAGLAVTSAAHGMPGQAQVLPAALLAGFVHHVVSQLGLLLLNEATEAGSGMDLQRNTPTLSIAVLNIGMPVMAVAMTAPFLDSPLVAFAILLCAQGFIYYVLRLLDDEYRERRQNHFLRETVSRYMPQPVASNLMESGGGLDLGGQTRHISVLFCDVRNFTAWAEQLDPEQVIAELNSMLGDLSQAIFRTEGTLDKFTGDGLMAFWNAPTDQSDHAMRAFNSARQMHALVSRANQKRAARGKAPFNVGIGVHTGPAMVGNIGHEQRINYTAVGDTVNLASRIESATAEVDCPILISEATFLELQLETQRECARLESIAVKGRRDRVRLFTLLSCLKERAA